MKSEKYGEICGWFVLMLFECLAPPTTAAGTRSLASPQSRSPQLPSTYTNTATTTIAPTKTKLTTWVLSSSGRCVVVWCGRRRGGVGPRQVFYSLNGRWSHRVPRQVTWTEIRWRSMPGTSSSKWLSEWMKWNKRDNNKSIASMRFRLALDGAQVLKVL